MNTPSPQRWAQLSPLLDELLDLPEPQRTARWSVLRTQDATLADELADLLAGAAQARQQRFLTGALATPTPDGDNSLVGTHIGAYVLEAPLGQGGTGSVWRARREDGRFDAAVAIKLLHLSLVGQTGAERFRREGHILASLTHPNIAHLLDAGVTPGGQPYLVIELVQGVQLDRHCNEHKLSVEARLALFDQVLDAIAHAHSHLVIHRDIKPGNILVGHDGKVKLLDFGIAKLLDQEGNDAAATALTREGGRALTPQYAAPEQLRGEPVTTATDVYALGVVLYQLLAGRHPTASAQGNAAAQMRATLETEPAPLARTLTNDFSLSEAARIDIVHARDTTLSRLRRALQGDLENILARALRKLPAERYATVAAFADDLRRHRAHEPVSAQPDSLAYRARKFVRRHRGAVAAGALTMFAIVAGLVGTVWQAYRAQAQTSLAQAATAQALAELERADAMTSVLEKVLGSVAERPFTTAELLARAEDEVNRQWASEASTQAFLLLQLAGMWSQLGDLGKVQALSLRASAAAHVANDEARIAHADCYVGGVHVLQGDFVKARLALDAALARARRAKPDEPQLALDCLAIRARLNEQEGQRDAMLADLNQALRLLESPRRGQFNMVRDLRELHADTLAEMGHRAQAVAEYDALARDLQRGGMHDSSAAATVLNNFTVLLLKSGQVQRALLTSTEGLRVLAKAQALDIDPASQANHASALFAAGHRAQAMPAYEKALSLANKSGDARSVGSVSLMAAEVWCSAGLQDRCSALIDAAQQRLGTMLPAGHVAFGRLAMRRAELALAAGNAALAQTHALSAQTILPPASNDLRRRVEALTLMVEINTQRGDSAAALLGAQETLALARQVCEGFTHCVYLGNAWMTLAGAQKRSGEISLAKESARTGIVQLEVSAGLDAPLTEAARRFMAGL